jgi:cytochrome P450
MTKSDLLTRPLEATSPLSPEVLAHPHEYNERLRREAPVYRCPHTRVVFVSDYDTICAVAKDYSTFSNRFGQAMRTEGQVDPGSPKPRPEGTRRWIPC